MLKNQPGETRERLLVERDFRDRGGIDGVYSGEFDGAFTAIRSVAAHRFEQWVLEDVFDRDSAGGNFDFADLFSGKDRQVFFDFSQGGTRRPDDLDTSAQSSDDCVCDYGDSVFFVDEGHWEESGKSLCDRGSAADRRDCDVVY